VRAHHSLARRRPALSLRRMRCHRKPRPRRTCATSPALCLLTRCALLGPAAPPHALSRRTARPQAAELAKKKTAVLKQDGKLIKKMLEVCDLPVTGTKVSSRTALARPPRVHAAVCRRHAHACAACVGRTPSPTGCWSF
jgi:hypothetical protein